MCGIAGITKKIDSSAIGDASLSMAHRGPDGDRSYVDERCTLIHRRLSIIDLDVRALQPMWDSDETVALVYNGEIYNYRELKRDLEKEYQFRTTSDTEVIIYGYKKYGDKIWAKLSGMFAAALYDTKAGTVILARDHAGMKPLFYTVQDGVLSFASELRTLFSLTKQTPTDLLTREMLERYFALGYIPAPDTLYRGIRVLPRGSTLRFDLSARTYIMTHFEPEVDPQSEEQSLETLLENSVERHLVADVPVGLFFSGGVDSSIVAALLHKHGVDLRTYSLSMPSRDADHEYGSKIAQHLGMHVAHTLFDQRASEESYEGVTRSIDTPLADISLLPTWYISKIAQKEVTVVLSGEGGDELFFGYPRQALMRRRPPLPFLLPFLSAYARAPYHSGKGIVYAQLARAIDAASFYIATCSPAFQSVHQKTIQHMRTRLAESDPLYFDRDFYLENMLLRKLDFATMRHSLEGRMPLLAPELFVKSQQEAVLFRRGDGRVGKPALKKVLEKYVPSELIYRPKSGFGFSPAQLVSHCARVRDDFSDAYSFLHEWGVGPAMIGRKEWLINEKPGMVMASILLHRAIINAGTKPTCAK